MTKYSNLHNKKKVVSSSAIMIYLPRCAFSVKAKLSQARSKNLQFILTCLPSFFSDTLTSAQKKFFKGTRSEPWWQRHVKMEVGVKLGIFSVWIDRKIHFSLSVLSLRSVTQIGSLMGGKKHKQKHFYITGLQQPLFSSSIASNAN